MSCQYSIDISKKLNSGEELSSCLSSFPRIFAPITVGLIEAGEAGGILSEVLDRLALLLEAKAKIKGQITGALIYPVAILVLAVSISLALLIFIVPTFDEMFKATETNSPKFINIDNNYYIFEILETKEKLLTLENKELKKMIISQIKIIDQIEKIGKILRDIWDYKFNKNNMIKLAQKNNSSVNTLTIKNINDDTKFNKKLLEEIYK